MRLITPQISCLIVMFDRISCASFVGTIVVHKAILAVFAMPFQCSYTFFIVDFFCRHIIYPLTYLRKDARGIRFFWMLSVAISHNRCVRCPLVKIFIHETQMESIILWKPQDCFSPLFMFLLLLFFPTLRYFDKDCYHVSYFYPRMNVCSDGETM